ncbi:phosphotriesterase-related protein-like [Acanthaster planci]|uniref:Phosphotriesterase-related protein-like n=1 Tax=Acanthaster planci TaxID=133434 RepID=A0A8B7YRX7_ACAPL|nr:phosphotriesterase-related protein-like [Acanthaster planci]
MSTHLSGKIQTVLGPIAPGDLGITLTHEHLNIDYKPYFKEPPAKYKDNIQLPLTIGNLWWIHRYPYSCWDNLELKTVQKDVMKELQFFHENGGRSIVDATTIGIGRNLTELAELSKESGVNIIAGAGYYLGHTHPPEMSTMTQEELVQGMVHEVTTGADGTKLKCGVIGEIGCSTEILPNERKVLQATAEAQSQLGCPVLIHPGRHPKCPADCLRVLQEAGGDSSKTVMSHIDRCLFNRDQVLEFAEMGALLEFDFFGTEVSYYQYDDTLPLPSDIQRICLIKILVEEGYGDKVVISHDLHRKMQLMNYGGHGYSHIVLNVLPRMLTSGLSADVIDKITIDNPRNWLTFK